MAVAFTGALRAYRSAGQRERFPADAVQVKIAGPGLGRVAFRIGKHHESHASLVAGAAVCMAKVGIKINGIAGSHELLITAQQKAQCSAQDVDKLETQMRMGFGFRLGKREKLGQVRMEFPLSSTGVESGQDI